MKVDIPFKPDFRSQMIMGEKTWTSRNKQYGKPGDYFLQFDCQFLILEVEKLSLSVVADNWKLEGCKSREHFIEVWTSLHHLAGFNPVHIVFTHKFRQVTCRDCLLVQVDEPSGGDIDGCCRDDVIDELVHQYNSRHFVRGQKPFDLDRLRCEEGHGGKGFIVPFMQRQLEDYQHPFCRECVNFCKKKSTELMGTFASGLETRGIKVADFCKGFSKKSEDQQHKEFTEHHDALWKAREKAYNKCRQEIFKEIPQ